MLVNIDEIYDLALKANDDPYGHPATQVLDNFDNFRCLLTPSFLIELISLIREAEKDAERYQWLRDRVCMFYVSAEGCDSRDAYLTVTGYGDDCSREVVDAAIDEQMKEKGDE